jgi:hypothetical protein
MLYLLQAVQQYEFSVSRFIIFLTMDKPAGAVTPSATAQDLMKKILYRAQGAYR